MNYPKFYTRTIVLDGKYTEIAIKEEIKHQYSINAVDDTIFKVIATGAYGQIKITDGHNTFICANPFRNTFGKLEDNRPDFTGLSLTSQYVAVCEDKELALDMRNMQFDLTSEVMANLHSKIYIPRANKEYWIELTEENLSSCKE